MTTERTRRIVSLVFPWLLLAVALTMVFTRLPSARGILPLWRPWAEIGVLALGMTAVLIAGGIDLSVGSIVALSGVAMGLLWQRAGWPITAAGAAGVLAGTIAGALNGCLIAAGVVPLLATLATMALYAGLAMSLSEGARITGFPEVFQRLGQGDVAGLPWQIVLLAVVAMAMAVIVHATRFGRHLFAVGDNRRAARFAAVPVRAVDWRLYALNGFLAGLAALWFTARRGAAVADAGAGLELQAIACVVLGGTRVTGGAGSVGRTLLGLAVLANREIGLRLWGSTLIRIPLIGVSFVLNANSRLIVIGLLLIIVAVFNERLVPHDREAAR